jgi:hypothetical protein
MRSRTAPAASTIARWRSRLTRFVVVSGVTAAVAAASVVAAAPASAGPGCPTGFHCLFDEIGGAGHAFFASDPSFRDNFYGNGEPVDNNSSVAVNSTSGGNEAHYYDGYNYTVFLFCLNPGTGVVLPPALRDKASSARLRQPTTIRCL